MLNFAFLSSHFVLLLCLYQHIKTVLSLKLHTEPANICFELLLLFVLVLAVMKDTFIESIWENTRQNN